MIRPFTCICLLMAAGSGLYLYQVKQRAFALDADLRSTFHDIDAARDRTRMLKADWALMNDPERLQTLATQYLTLQPMGPTQLLTMDQLASALPAPGAPKAAPADDQSAPPTQGAPMAAATPMVLPHTSPLPQIASIDPAPAAQPDPPPAVLPPLVSQTVSAPVLPPAAQLRPRLASTKHATRPVPTPVAPQGRSWLASAGDTATTAAPARLAEAVATPRPVEHRVRHHIVPVSASAPVQLYAANEVSRPARIAPIQRITPPAATVMYSQASGSSLGMADAASLAPPRPLYSSSQ